MSEAVQGMWYISLSIYVQMVQHALTILPHAGASIGRTAIILRLEAKHDSSGRTTTPSLHPRGQAWQQCNEETPHILRRTAEHVSSMVSLPSFTLMVKHASSGASTHSSQWRQACGDEGSPSFFRSMRRVCIVADVIVAAPLYLVGLLARLDRRDG